MFESGIEEENDSERLEDNLDALYLGATTRHQWQVLVSTLAASKKEHAEKKAHDNEERKKLVGNLKKGKKIIRGNKRQNLVGGGLFTFSYLSCSFECTYFWGILRDFAEIYLACSK